MTKQLRAAIEIINRSLGSPKNILEVGSRQAINQNELADFRKMFPKANYVGMDMQKGPGVDVVANGENIPFKKNTFDLIFCFETLEHTEKPWLVCAEIERVAKAKGLIIVSSQQNFPIHKHPSDYFRYTPYGLRALFPTFKNNIVFSISPPFDDEVKLNPQHVIFVGSKSGNIDLLKKISRKLKQNKSLISVHKPYSHRLDEVWRLLKRAYHELFFRQEIKFFK